MRLQSAPLLAATSVAQAGRPLLHERHDGEARPMGCAPPVSAWQEVPI